MTKPMMTPRDWRDLAVETVRNPAAAATQLMGMNIPREAVWTTLFLVAVANAALMVLTNFLFPAPSPLPQIFQAPIVYMIVVSCLLIVSIYTLLFIGRSVGGRANIGDIMILIVWLHVLRVLVQAFTLALMFVMPFLAIIVMLAASVAGIYIMANFINQAHGFNSLPRSVGVLVVSGIATLLGLAVVVSLILGTFAGTSGYV